MRSASPNCDQQPRGPSRAICAIALSRLGQKAERTAILDLIRPRVEELPEMQDSFSGIAARSFRDGKQVLVERHLISREHAAETLAAPS